jgi:hypothetical protein
MSNFKQVVIDFLVSKLPVIYHPLLSSYLVLSKNIGKNKWHMIFVVKATYIESTDYFNMYFPLESEYNHIILQVNLHGFHV